MLVDRVVVAAGTEDDVDESFVFLPRDAAVETNHSRGPTWQPPEGGVQMRTFAPESKSLAAFVVKLSPNLSRVLLARTRPRESRPQGRRTRSASASRGSPRLADDPDEDLARPPLSPAVREFLRREIDHRRRRQLVDERGHLQVVPSGGGA
jgi:hypothetical protein